MSFLTTVNTRISFRLSVPDGQYKLKLECKILRFPKNGFCMHTIVASRPSSASSAKIVHSYPLLQFCCMININNLQCGLQLSSGILSGLLSTSYSRAGIGLGVQFSLSNSMSISSCRLASFSSSPTSLPILLAVSFFFLNFFSLFFFSCTNLCLMS